MKKSILAVGVAALLPGCATNSASKLVQALKDDPSGFSLNVVGWGSNIHIVRANPGSNTPPYRLTPDGGVQVLEQTQGAAPSATQNDVLMRAIDKIPSPPVVQ